LIEEFPSPQPEGGSESINVLAYNDQVEESPEFGLIIFYTTGNISRGCFE